MTNRSRHDADFCGFFYTLVERPLCLVAYVAFGSAPATETTFGEDGPRPGPLPQDTVLKRSLLRARCLLLR